MSLVLAAAAREAPLPEALRDPACYPHAVAGRVELVETHISWVLLAGDYAYKLKKPVRLPFLDFSTLDARRRYCEEELRLNRRTAPELYLEVVPLVRTARGPAFGAPGEPLDYAVRMRRFPDDALADAMAARGALGPAEVDAMAEALVRFHAALPAAAPGDDWGAPARIAAPALGNFDQLAALGVAPADAAALEPLRAWTEGECRRLAPVFEARRAEGRVRECHGDLHLGNIAFVGGRAMPFDCIEFDPALRWNDMASEVAFLVADLLAHALPWAAWRLLNAWLERTGDYGSVAVLRFYLVYRAMVRAKVARLRPDDAAFRRYLRVAQSLARSAPPALLLMHGLSGSGKTTLSQALLERLGAVRVRSDVERKRLHGLDAAARAGAPPGAGIYSEEASRRTYERLGALAQGILGSGWSALVDAAFLKRGQRDALRALAARLGAPCAIVDCVAPPEELRRRLRARAALGADASDADVAVLEDELRRAQPLAADEEAIAVRAGGADARAAVEALAARFAAP